MASTTTSNTHVSLTGVFRSLWSRMASIAAHTDPLMTGPDLEAQALIAAVASPVTMSSDNLLAAATNLDASIIEQASRRTNVGHEMETLPLSAPSKTRLPAPAGRKTVQDANADLIMPELNPAVNMRTRLRPAETLMFFQGALF